MKTDSNTGRTEIGSLYESERQRTLATEAIKTRFHIEALQKDLPQVIAKNPDAVIQLREAIKAGYDKLSEIDRQAREEQKRLNKLRFPEQYDG